MTQNRSTPLFMTMFVVIILGVEGCVSVEEFRTLDGYVPDASTVARLNPDEARRILRSCDDLSLSSSALQGTFAAENLSIYSHKINRYMRQGNFDIKIKSIQVTGNKLLLLHRNDNGSHLLPLRDVNARIYIGTNGLSDLYPFVALNDHWLLRGFTDISSGMEQNKPTIDRAKQIVDAVFVIKQAATRPDESDFRNVAQAYRAANPKPPFPEEARKFKVQAEAAVREKDFDGAADSYAEAIKVAPWWPEGHFNLALVLGETGDYETAMREMKRYLMLVPDAPDARAAQDKIYEWERKAGR